MIREELAECMNLERKELINLLEENGFIVWNKRNRIAIRATWYGEEEEQEFEFRISPVDWLCYEVLEIIQR